MLAGRTRRAPGTWSVEYLPTVWLSHTSFTNNLGCPRKLELEWWANAMGDKGGVAMGIDPLSITLSTKFIEEKL